MPFRNAFSTPTERLFLLNAQAVRGAVKTRRKEVPSQRAHMGVEAAGVEPMTKITQIRARTISRLRKKAFVTGGQKGVLSEPASVPDSQPHALGCGRLRIRAVPNQGPPVAVGVQDRRAE